MEPEVPVRKLETMVKLDAVRVSPTLTGNVPLRVALPGNLAASFGG